MNYKLKTIWTTRNGMKINIKDMSMRHLQNTIRMIERICKAEYLNELEACSSYEPRGDMASYYAEQAISEISPEDFIPQIYYNMKKELERRKNKERVEYAKSKLRNNSICQIYERIYNN